MTIRSWQRDTACVAALLAGSCGPRTTSDVKDARNIEMTLLGGTANEDGLRICTFAGQSEGESSMFPPLEARCARGADRKCVVSDSPVEAHEYRRPDDPFWRHFESLTKTFETPTHFHKRVAWGKSRGQCRFTAAIYGDLDDDSVYSTYERIEVYDIPDPLPAKLRDDRGTPLIQSVDTLINEQIDE